VIHPKPWDTIIRATKVFAYPTVVISTFSFVFFQYWWICSLLTMEPAAYATYKLQVQGLFFLGLILGTVFAEILFSGRLSDWLVIFLAKRNNGIRSPEMRVWLRLRNVWRSLELLEEGWERVDEPQGMSRFISAYRIY
jgi:hypothetical protein